MNTNSNSYTIIYASVMVIIVAFLLAFVSSSLKDIQETNVELDKKKQILGSLNIDLDGQDAAALYTQYVKQELIVSTNGEIIAQTGAFDINAKVEAAKGFADRQLPVYVCEVEGKTKYVVSMYGAGLWGPIWGYLALNDDKDSVYGVYFSHKGETPGLGAEIATEHFQKPFIGKHIKRNGELASIAIVKPGKSVADRDYVDGISGGTITCQGVDLMISNDLNNYKNFLNK